jgi:hypothetical protein
MMAPLLMVVGHHQFRCWLTADSTIPAVSPHRESGSHKQDTSAQRSPIEYSRTMGVTSVRDTPRSPLGFSISTTTLVQYCSSLVQEKNWTRVCGALAEAEQTAVLVWLSIDVADHTVNQLCHPSGGLAPALTQTKQPCAQHTNRTNGGNCYCPSPGIGAELRRIGLAVIGVALR